YDIGSARIKYNEGFWQNPRTKEIISKPAQFWSVDDVTHVEPLYYTFACALALQSAVFFLLMAFWSFISKSVAKSSFMSSFEFKVNIVASVLVVVLFPTIQFTFRNDHALREAVPQLIFSILMLSLGGLGIRTQFKLKVLLEDAKALMNETTATVVFKLEYFKDMNLVLTISFFGCGIPLAIVSIDGLLAEPVIAVNKLASDILITNLNFFAFVIWVTLTLIFYPRRTVSTTAPFKSSDVSVSQPQRPVKMDPSMNKLTAETYNRSVTVDVLQPNQPCLGFDKLVAQKAGKNVNMAFSINVDVDSGTTLKPPVITSGSCPVGSESPTLYYQDSLKKALNMTEEAKPNGFTTYDLGGSIRYEESSLQQPHSRARSVTPSTKYPQQRTPQRSVSQTSQHPLIEAITSEYQNPQTHRRTPSLPYQPRTKYRPASRSANQQHPTPGPSTSVLTASSPSTSSLTNSATDTTPSFAGNGNHGVSDGCVNNIRSGHSDRYQLHENLLSEAGHSNMNPVRYEPKPEFSPLSFYENLPRTAEIQPPQVYSRG
ncbi:hypothetical protein BGZ94_004134, partial [Podila epigama]